MKGWITMTINKKLMDIAEYAGCTGDIRPFDSIIEGLKTSKLKNIAVLGDICCGKTSLINKLAGTEVRKPSDVSRGEPPMMVTFGSDEKKEGFEKHDVSNRRCSDAGVSFYEIPAGAAIDPASGKPSLLLEQMDAIIYIIPATAPLSRSDIEVLDVLANRFPAIIFISKLDIPEEDDRKQTIDYVESSLSGQYSGIPFRFFNNIQENYPDKIIGSLEQIGLDDLREFHIMQLEYLAKETVISNLRRMENDLKVRRRERENEQFAAGSLDRDKEIEWNNIRITMLEKQREATDLASKEIAGMEQETKEEILSNMERAGDDGAWVKKEIKGLLERRVNEYSAAVMKKTGQIADAHTAWLVSEVSHKFDIDLPVSEMERKASYISSDTEDYDNKRSYKSLLIAIGSGALAGGAITGKLTIAVPYIAIPAALLTIAYTIDHFKDTHEYHKKAREFAESCCSDAFAKLKEQTISTLKDYYEELISEIKTLCEHSRSTVDFSDLDREEAEIMNKINEINGL